MTSCELLAVFSGGLFSIQSLPSHSPLGCTGRAARGSAVRRRAPHAVQCPPRAALRGGHLDSQSRSGTYDAPGDEPLHAPCVQYDSSARLPHACHFRQIRPARAPPLRYARGRFQCVCLSKWEARALAWLGSCIGRASRYSTLASIARAPHVSISTQATNPEAPDSYAGRLAATRAAPHARPQLPSSSIWLHVELYRLFPDAAEGGPRLSG